MSHENIREFKTSLNRDDERADDGDKPQLKRSKIKETGQQTIAPISIIKSLQNQVTVSNLASTSGTINVSVNVGKLQF